MNGNKGLEWLVNHAAELNSSKEFYAAQFDAKSREAAKLQADLFETQGELKDADERIAFLDGQLDEYDALITSLRDQLEAVRLDMAAVVEHRDALITENEELKDALKTARVARGGALLLAQGE